MNESSDANDQGAEEAPTPGEPEAGSADAAQKPSDADYQFAEPTLGDAEISDDVAQSVDLEAAEAEAAQVAYEAELAARSVSAGLAEDIHPPSTLGSIQPKRDVTTPVAPTNVSQQPSAQEQAPQQPSDAEAPTFAVAANEELPGEAPEDEEPAAKTPGQSIADGHGWHRPETPWQQSATPWQPKAGGWQSPAQIARGEADAAAASAAAATSGVAGDQFQDQHLGDETPTPGIAAPAAQTNIPAAPVLPPAASTPGAGGHGGQPPVSGPQGPGSNEGGVSGKKKLLIILGIVVLAVVLLGVLVTLLINFITANFSSSGTAAPAQSQSLPSKDSSSDPSPNSSANSGADIVAAEASPLDWVQDNCLRDFRGVSQPADVVLCNSPHSAQLVGTFYYDDAEEFPGTEALKAKAADVCQSVQLTTEAEGNTDLKQITAYPSESTWNESDDRRVDCIIQDSSGNNLTSSLVP